MRYHGQWACLYAVGIDWLEEASWQKKKVTTTRIIRKWQADRPTDKQSKTNKPLFHLELSRSTDTNTLNEFACQE